MRTPSPNDNIIAGVIAVQHGHITVGQGGGCERGDTWYGPEERSIFTGTTSLTDDFLQFLDALLNLLQIGERIVHLGGVPTTEPAPISLGETIHEMLELDQEQEAGAIRLNTQIIEAAEQQGDSATKELFQRILADEEKHHRIFTEMLQG